MKKLTPNQTLYKKEITRIRRNLSKLRNKGYDVSALAQKYSTTIPKRVTKQAIQRLHEITPKKLQKELQHSWSGFVPPKHTPLSTPPSQFETVYAPTTFPELPLIPTSQIFVPPVLPRDFMEIPSFETPEEETIEEIPEEVEREEESLVNTIVDVDNGKVLTIDAQTGEIIEESPLYIEDDDEGGEIYINGDTGEIVGRNPNALYKPPTIDEQALEKLEEIINSFYYQLRLKLQDILAQMIAEKGLQAVAEAFVQTGNNRPNMLERFATANERYEEIVAVLEEMADILDLPIDIQDELRDYVYRESMSDIEEYRT